MTHDARTFMYLDCDIPPGVSIPAWRERRMAAREPAWRRLTRRVAPRRRG